MKVTLERLDTKNSQAKYNLDIPENGLEIGRGPLLKIDVTNISRKKAILSFKNGCLYMKCVKNPGVIIDHDATTGTEQVVDVSHGDVELVDGDVIKFDANQFFFKVSYVPEKCDMKNENSDTTNNCQNKENTTNASDDQPSCSKDSNKNDQILHIESKKRLSSDDLSTGTSAAPPVKKARKLPDWMLNMEDTGNENKSPAKATSKKCTKTPVKKSPMKDKENVDENKINSEVTKTKHCDIKSSFKQKEKEEHENEKDDLTENVIEKENIKTDTEHLGEQSTKEILSTSIEHQGEPSTKEIHAPSTNEQTKLGDFMDEKIGDLLEDSSLKVVSDESVGMVYPVLINPSDLQDSDQETTPVKKDKKRKKGADKGANNAPGRSKCPYGQNCYRKNPLHFQQESHPGDPDYQESDESDDDDENDDRPECEYGVDCYRKNPQHKKDFKHTRLPQPKRQAKQKARKKKSRDSDDEYESDFIDDEEDLEEDIDDTDEDENWTPPDSDED